MPDREETRPVLRVLLIARQPIARAGIEGLLAGGGEATVVGATDSLNEAESLIAELRADVALAVFYSGSIDEVLALTEALAPTGTPLVLLADSALPLEAGAAVRAGVRGLLRGDATADELVGALRAASSGILALDPWYAQALTALEPTPTAAEAISDRTLSERELEVLRLVATGLPNKAIAKRLDISEHTVKFHVGSIFSKLDAVSRTDAVTRAARRGLLAL